MLDLREAIVVLGAAQYDGEPSPALANRLDHAAQLYRDGIAPLIVVTGGRQEGDRFTEAEASANYLAALGVPGDAIERETTGHNSWESLASAARFLQEDGINDVVLVSDGYHAMRIAGIAERARPRRRGVAGPGDSSFMELARETVGGRGRPHRRLRPPRPPRRTSRDPERVSAVVHARLHTQNARS